MTDRDPTVEFAQATAARLAAFRDAWQYLAQAATGIDPLKSTADGVLTLCAAARGGGAPVESSVRDDFACLMQAVKVKVIEAAGADLSRESISLALGAAVQAFWIACGRPEEVEKIEHDEALVLANAVCWICFALQELHSRRVLQTNSEKLHRRVLGNLAFAHAVPGEHLH